MVRNMNDGTRNPPYLRVDINAGNLQGAGPKGEPRAVYQAIREAGFRGVQGGDASLCRELGLGFTTAGRVDRPEQADAAAKSAKDAGAECSTLHVGWGMEDDATIDRILDGILNASARHDLPLYIETHRATITQDLWRTVQFTRRFPDVRFNGDFSHWYTGLEMVYGDINAKWEFIQPVFDRVRFMHGRIGNPGCIQVDIGDGTGRTYVDHFREMWMRSLAGFLKTAQPGDYIVFTPELLPANIYYARTFPNARGELVEEGDRWQQALLYKRIIEECWEKAGAVGGRQ